MACRLLTHPRPVQERAQHFVLFVQPADGLAGFGELLRLAAEPVSEESAQSDSRKQERDENALRHQVTI